MTNSRQWLLMTTAAALCAMPVLAFGQQNTGGSSQIQGTTQTTPQQGTDRGMPAARGAATTGSDTGQAPNTGGIAPNAAGNPGQQSTSGVGGNTTNPSGNGMGQSQPSTGGRAAAPGTPGATGGGNPGPSQAQIDNMRRNEGNTTGNDARPGAASSTDGRPGNPPSTATQRAADSVTGNRTDPDGTGNNPPGTAAGRAIDRATDGRSTTPGTTTDSSGRAAAPATGAVGSAATGATSGMMAVDSARLQGGRRASKVIGSTVYNEENESVGSVDDIIVTPGTGQPVAVLSVGGFLGIGARLVAVPYERLQHNAERDRWMLQGATRDSLRSLPEYSYDGDTRRG